MFALIGLVITLLELALGILLIVSNCFIFKKAGEKWWKALIPIYNAYVFYKIAWKTEYFKAMLIAAIVYGIAYVFLYAGLLITSPGGLLFLAILLFAVAVVMLVAEIALLRGLCKNFGAGVGFFFGLLFLPFIFFPILAFSKRYQYFPEYADKKRLKRKQELYSQYEEQYNDFDRYQNY